MYWSKTSSVTTYHQDHILKEMENIGLILPTDPINQGICFPLTLHTINKYIEGLISGNPAKAETFGEKYVKVYNHCVTETDLTKKTKHCNNLIGEYLTYSPIHLSTADQAAIISNTIVACGFDATLNPPAKPMVVLARQTVAAAEADLTTRIEHNTNVVILMCLNYTKIIPPTATAPASTKPMGHTVALVRKNNTLDYLDVSARLDTYTEHTTAPTTHTPSTKKFVQQMLSNTPTRTMTDVSYAVIFP